jgi:nucleotide-binding universal stress UspA family protein
MPMKDYRTIVVGTDGSSLAEPTVGRAAWLAKHNDADLVIVCAYAQMSRRTEAKNIATLGGDTRTGQVLGREAASVALADAMRVASAEGATVAAALLIDGDPSTALVVTAEDRSADLVVLEPSTTAASLTVFSARRPPKSPSGPGATCSSSRPEKNLGELEVPEDALPE